MLQTNQLEPFITHTRDRETLERGKLVTAAKGTRREAIDFEPYLSQIVAFLSREILMDLDFFYIRYFTFPQAEGQKSIVSFGCGSAAVCYIK
jgi:hypothetical protein